MSLQRCMAETTSREFVEWQQFFKQELKHPTREELYLAQVAAEVRRYVSRLPSRVHLSQFILPLAAEKKSKRPKDVQRRIAESKAFWTAVAYGGGRRGRDNANRKRA